MLRVLALVLLTGLAAPLSVAQDPPIRWGRISDAEKAIDAWPDDPDASAIVLGDIGFAEIKFDRGTGQPYYRIRRHTRVKVLDEEAYDMGEFAMRYNRENRVFDVRAQTFAPDGSDYRRVELGRRDIRDERIDDEMREVRFSMPALAPGAIFEFEYTYEGSGITVVGPWNFQRSEPTLVSEYRFETPQYFDYVSLLQGPSIVTHPPERINGRDYISARYRWTAENVSALRDEPYTTTELDYIERIRLQLSRVNRPDGFTDNVLSDWRTLAQELRDNEYFGRRMAGSRRLRAIAAGVEGTVAEKAQALYDLVRTEYVWDGTGGTIFAARDLDDVAESKSGTEAELTLLLLTLYREAGVPALPVVLSGRSHGRALPQYPIVDQFDTILAFVQVPGQPSQLVSPTSPHRPYGELPVDALNTDAWVVDYDSPSWIQFDAPGGSSTTTLVRGTLSEDGAFSGTLQLRLAGYDATHARERLAEADSDSPTSSGEAVGEAADAEEDVEIITTSIEGEVGEPLKIEGAFVAPGAEVAMDEIYVVPFIAMQLDENPFKRETRAFPVDYTFPRTRTYIADIDLPEGWEAIDLPDPIQMTIPSRKVSYQRTVGERPGGVQVRAVLTIRRSEVDTAEYAALREMYDEIVATEAEALVIARATPAAEDADGAAPEASKGGDDAEEGDEGGR